MLIPAALRKEEIEHEFRKLFYSTSMMYYRCSSNHQQVPSILADYCDPDIFQFAIVEPSQKLVGYMCYNFDQYSGCVHNIAIISFDNMPNMTVGTSVFRHLDELIHRNKIHRMSFDVVEDNPIKTKYDKFCQKYGGSSFTLHDVFKDREGNYHNTVTYEILFDNKEKME